MTINMTKIFIGDAKLWVALSIDNSNTFFLKIEKPETNRNNLTLPEPESTHFSDQVWC